MTYVFFRVPPKIVPQV